MSINSGRKNQNGPAGHGLTSLNDFDKVYSDGIATDWNKVYIPDLIARSKELISKADTRLAAIRQAHSQNESEIRSKYDRAQPPSDLTVRPITLSETAALPAFKEHWWKFGVSTLILCWIVANFSFAVVAGAAAIAGQLWWLQKRQHDEVNAKQADLDADHARFQADRDTSARMRQELAAKTDHLTEKHHETYTLEKQPIMAEWSARCKQFNDGMLKMRVRFDEIMATVGTRFAPFSDDDPVHEVIEHLDEQLSFRIGDREMCQPRRVDKELALTLGLVERPAAIERRFPVFYELTTRKALLIDGETKPASAARHRLFETVMTRVLRQIPPGKAIFTLIDPLGLGANFSHFLKLQDYSDTLINGTVWTNRDQIKRRLRDSIEHIERVTQKYLRADYADIESYNREAQEIAEPYRFMCIADFPEGFDEEAVRDLIKIVQNGPRCGIHTLIYLNRNVKPSYGINLDEFLPFCQVLKHVDGHDQLVTGEKVVAFAVDAQPKSGQIKRLVDSFGAGAVDAMKVEVPFSMLFELAKLDPERWTESSAQGISVPLGPSGARKALMMTFDSKLSHNALVVGRPGSGKSNLIHVFISMVCHRYSPDEVEMYLVDFKKGVEFKDYANVLLPHARVIAVESEREFGISVLRALDKEMTLRSELFKKADAAENISEYRGRKPDARMPRAVLIVDEFQEFFTKEDKIKSEAALLFDRIIRQGRSFGVHVLLGTQSLANSGLARSTIDQVPIRIALQCSEADSRLILSDDNVTARGLNRPGEAIYNDKAGLIEGNKQFQVALFGGSERKTHLGKLMKHVVEAQWRGDPPRIFEGHESASLATCKPLMTFKPHAPSSVVKIWLGEPVSLDDPVYGNLGAQGGRNMLVLARDEEQGTNVIMAALTSLASQFTAKDLHVHIVDLTTADAPWANYPEDLSDIMPQHFDVYGRHGMRELLPQLRQLVKDRQQQSEEQSDVRSFIGARTVLAIIGSHRARELRVSDEATTFTFDRQEINTPPDLATCLKEIVREGPDQGVNTMLWSDSYANFERIFDRRVLGEFGIRVSGALPEKDSHTVFDNQVAAQIAHPNRMVKYDDDIVGVYEMFRPYAVGSEAVFRNLKQRWFSAT